MTTTDPKAEYVRACLKGEAPLDEPSKAVTDSLRAEEARLRGVDEQIQAAKAQLERLIAARNSSSGACGALRNVLWDLRPKDPSPPPKPPE